MALVLPESAPESLGGYRLIKRLAVGGMGEVFLAEQETPYFTRQVAIKRALPHVAAERGFVERLIDEARLMTRLHHGNIIHVHELQQEGAELYMVMEYLPGLDVRSLNQRLEMRGERWPSKIAAYVVHEVCLGLDYAHKARDEEGVPLGVIHRDLSPSNILLGAEGEVKLIDFGVARARGGIHQSVAGSLQGKLAYVSPEQARGEPLTLKTDLFSLGVTLFEMLSGMRPLEAEQDVGLLILAQKGSYRRLSELQEARPELELDPQLCALVDRAMALDPAERFNSAGELALALSEWLHRAQGPEHHEVDRLALKGWLEPRLEETGVFEAPALDRHHSPSSGGSDGFSAALEALIDQRAQGAQGEGTTLPTSRGPGGGVTLTLSVDVQAEVKALEALPPIEALEADEISAGAQEEASEPPPVSPSQLSRARYTALSLMILSVMTLLFSMRGSRSPLTIGLSEAEVDLSQISSITVDGEAWSATRPYDERTPLEVCAWRAERSACLWVTPTNLSSYQELSEAQREQVTLWGGVKPAQASKVALLSTELLSRLKQAPINSIKSIFEPVTSEGGQAQGAQGDSSEASVAGSAVIEESATEGGTLDLGAQGSASVTSAPQGAQRTKRAGPRASLKSRGTTPSASTPPARWHTFVTTPPKAKVSCTPAHPADQEAQILSRPGLRCEVAASGYATQNLEMKGLPARVTVSLKQLARVNIRVIPATATLQLDGAPVSNPLKRHPLAPGAHTLLGQFEHQGERWTERQTFSLEQGERRSIVLELKPPR